MKLHSYPFPFLSSRALTTPLFIAVGGLGSVHPTLRCQQPAARGRAPRNFQQLHI